MRSERGHACAATDIDGFFLRGLKWVGDRVICFSLAFPRFNLTLTVLAVALAGLFVVNLDRDFLPPFNEGSMQLNVVLPPGTSLATSNEINKTVEQRLLELDDVDVVAVVVKLLKRRLSLMLFSPALVTKRLMLLKLSALLPALA